MAATRAEASYEILVAKQSPLIEADLSEWVLQANTKVVPPGLFGSIFSSRVIEKN